MKIGSLYGIDILEDPSMKKDEIVLTNVPLDTPYKGLVKIGDKVYSCQVVDGVRYIDGKTVEKFLETLTMEQLAIVCNKGLEIVRKHFKDEEDELDNSVNP